jgi:hypothetical protein
MYYKPSGRRSVNRTYGAPMYARNQNFGVKVEHDNFGRVRRVGMCLLTMMRMIESNVGSVYMAYNRFVLEQVGDYRLFTTLVVRLLIS